MAAEYRANYGEPCQTLNLASKNSGHLQSCADSQPDDRRHLPGSPSTSRRLPRLAKGFASPAAKPLRTHLNSSFFLFTQLFSALLCRFSETNATPPETLSAAGVGIEKLCRYMRLILKPPVNPCDKHLLKNKSHKPKADASARI